MADIIDDANRLAELNLQSSLNQVKKISGPKATGPKATGFCLYCNEQLHTDSEISEIEGGKFEGLARRWCDAHCRDLWEKYGAHDE